MPWKSFDLEEWAEELGVDLETLREKEKLIKQIVSARKKLELTQKQLAELVGVSQSRIGQIESRVKMDKITFDVLISILREIGYDCSIRAKKTREPDLEDIAA